MIIILYIIIYRILYSLIAILIFVNANNAKFIFKIILKLFFSHIQTKITREEKYKHILNTKNYTKIIRKMFSFPDKFVLSFIR